MSELQVELYCPIVEMPDEAAVRAQALALAQALVTDKTEVLPPGVRPANSWAEMLASMPPQAGLA